MDNQSMPSKFRTLRKWVDPGFSNLHQPETDDDLKLLRNDPRFAVFVTEMQKHAEAGKPSNESRNEVFLQGPNPQDAMPWYDLRELSPSRRSSKFCARGRVASSSLVPAIQK
jgi:hypothetical protein